MSLNPPAHKATEDKGRCVFMKNSALLYGVIGLLAGSFITYIISTNKTGTLTSHMNQMMQEDTGMMGTHGMNMTMNDMTTALRGKTGDAFDKAFIEMMIDHHQGAVDMANLAKQNAKHAEIKQMADDIIAAQTKEIGQMNEWYKTWNY